MKTPTNFEMLKILAEAHRDLKRRPTRLPKKVETMKVAYDDICHGEDPWTALGNFTNAWYSYASHIRPELVNEPLTKPEQETEHTRRWAAFCAASVEFLCERYHVTCPNWVHDPSYILESPWWKVGRVDTPAIREHLSKVSPAPFAHRNIFCTNRLFQNKYEMSEWIAEAIEKGITNLSEIKAYARKKEISIHGA